MPFLWTESLVVFPGLVSYDSGIEAYMRSAGRKRKKERKEGVKERGEKEEEKKGREYLVGLPSSPGSTFFPTQDLLIRGPSAWRTLTLQATVVSLVSSFLMAVSFLA